MQRTLFVYWRADPATLHSTLAALRESQARLRADWPGLDARLWLRCDPGGAPTVMETYAAPGGIDAAGQARIEAAVAPLTPAPRHAEAFAAVDDGALPLSPG